jgi:hypothetical protein
VAEVRVSQLPILAEVAAQVVRVSQLPILVELDRVQVRVSQLVLLVELEYEPPQLAGGPPPAAGQSAAPPTPPAAAALPGPAVAAPAPVSAAAAALGNQLFTALAAGMASLAPTTVLALGGPGPGGSGMSEVRTVAVTVTVDWNRDGTYTDESANVVSVRGSQNLAAPEALLAGGRGQVAACSIVLHNAGFRYSTRNTSSEIYADIAGGGAYLAPVRVTVTIDSVDYRLFTGVVRSMNEAAPTPRQASSVTLECRSRDELLLQDKRSTELDDFIADSTAAHTEDYHIIQLLTRSGLVDGADFVSQDYADAHPGTLPSIDLGIFPLRYVWLDDESVLDELWNLVAACCGWCYCDADGVMRYHNITAVLPDALARQFGTLTTIELTASQVAGLQLNWQTNELYGTVTVEVAPRAPGEVDELWTPDDPVVVQPGATKIVWARLNSPTVATPTLEWEAFTAGGIQLTSGLTVTPEHFAQRVKLTIVNSGTQAAYFNTLRLTGQQLVGGRTVEVEANSSASFWSGRTVRKRSVRNNVYIQAESQAQTIADYLLKRQELPVLVASVPNLDRADVRLGWPVTIQYTGAVPAAGEITGIVSGLSWSCDRTGFHQDATILETGSLFAGYAPIFILGTHVLGAEDAEDEAYLFY